MKRFDKNKFAQKFTRNKDGQVAVIFGIFALPLMLVSTMAIDHRNTVTERVKLLDALDTVALAAVLDQTITPEERKEFAKHYFEKSYRSKHKVNFEVLNSSAQRVELRAGMDVPTSLGAVAGVQNLSLSETSVSVLTKGSVICMLALDPEGEGTFHIQTGGHFSAPTCSVQVNSTDTNAAIIDPGSSAMAKSFCVSGGVNGDFKPHANTECGLVADPYQYRNFPAPDTCVNSESLKSTLSTWQSEAFYDNFGQRSAAIATMQPGTYCGGLSLVGKNIEFAPGTYYISGGDLFFGSGTHAVGEDVTFVLSEPGITLQVDAGATLKFKAPDKGDFAGLVFSQRVGKVYGKAAPFPDGESVINSGGNLEIVGTAYLPTQKISFVGGSITDSQAPATSFIGYQIGITEGAKISVAVDHVSAGIPPVLPRSDEAARIAH